MSFTTVVSQASKLNHSLTSSTKTFLITRRCKGGMLLKTENEAGAIAFWSLKKLGDNQHIHSEDEVRYL